MMKIYARIENSVIVELFPTDGDISKMFAHALSWVDISLISPSPRHGWTTSDGGKTFSPPESPPITQIRENISCSAWQLRRALTQIGLRASVEATVAAADQDTKDMWEYAPVYHRTHPIVSTLATALNKTDADIDALFNLAISIQS